MVIGQHIVLLRKPRKSKFWSSYTMIFSVYTNALVTSAGTGSIGAIVERFSHPHLLFARHFLINGQRLNRFVTMHRHYPFGEILHTSQSYYASYVEAMVGIFT